MGGLCSTSVPVEPPSRFGAKKSGRIPDKYETIEEVTQALRQAGLEACQLIVGIDFTKSNEWNGAKTFGGRSLHSVDGPLNPYLHALSLIARTIESFDDDHLIPCYGFGDLSTSDRAVFSLYKDNAPAEGLQALLTRYRQLVPHVVLSGPTSFAPLIRQAMIHVYKSGVQFHLLLILADGQISGQCRQETLKAIRDISLFPISIVMIGVGDGPWDEMRDFDDVKPLRDWDNFQFVEFNKIMAANLNQSDKQREASFALHTLMELPDQYRLAQDMIGMQSNPDVSHIVNSIPETTLLDPPVQLDPAGPSAPLLRQD